MLVAANILRSPHQKPHSLVTSPHRTYWNLANYFYRPKNPRLHRPYPKARQRYEVIIDEPRVWGPIQRSAPRALDVSSAVFHKKLLPLLFPTAVINSKIAANESFPLIQPRNNASPSEPVASTSFAMAPNPISKEEEYFLRVDLSAAKISDDDSTKRPKVNLHVVIDIECIDNANDETRDLSKLRKALIAAKSMEDLEKIQTDPDLQDFVREDAIREGPKLEIDNVIGRLLNRLNHAIHSLRERQDAQHEARRRAQLEFHRKLFYKEKDPKLTDELDAEEFRLRQTKGEMMTGFMPQQFQDALDIVSWISLELESEDDLTVHARTSTGVHTIYTSTDHMTVPIPLSTDDVLTGVPLEYELEKPTVPDFLSSISHVVEKLDPEPQDLTKEERRILYLTNVNPFSKDPGAIAAKLHGIADKNIFLSVGGLKDIRDNHLQSFLNHIRGANYIPFLRPQSDLHFQQRFSLRDQGRGRFSELLVPRFFNLSVQPVLSSYQITATYDSAMDSYHYPKQPGIFLGSLCGHEAAESYWQFPDRQIVDAKPEQAYVDPNWLRAIYNIQIRPPPSLNNSTVFSDIEKDTIKDLSGDFWKSLTLEITVTLSEMLMPFKPTFEYYHADYMAIQWLEQKRQAMAATQLGILKQKLLQYAIAPNLFTLRAPAPPTEAEIRKFRKAAKTHPPPGDLEALAVLQQKITQVASEIVTIRHKQEKEARDAKNAKESEEDREAELEDLRDDDTQASLEKNQNRTDEEDTLFQILKAEEPERATRKLEREERKRRREEPPASTAPEEDPLGIQDHLYSNMAAIHAYHIEHQLNKKRAAILLEGKSPIIDIPWLGKGSIPTKYFQTEVAPKFAKAIIAKVQEFIRKETLELKRCLIDTNQLLDTADISKYTKAEIEEIINKPFHMAVDVLERTRKTWNSNIQNDYHPDREPKPKECPEPRPFFSREYYEPSVIWTEERFGTVVWKMQKTEALHDGIIFDCDTPSKTRTPVLQGDTVEEALQKQNEDHVAFLLFTYQDREGKTHFKKIPLSLKDSKFYEHYDEPGIKKAILLSRYSNIMARVFHNQFIKLLPFLSPEAPQPTADTTEEEQAARPTADNPLTEEKHQSPQSTTPPLPADATALNPQTEEEHQAPPPTTPPLPADTTASNPPTEEKYQAPQPTIPSFPADTTALNPLTEEEQQGLAEYYHKVLAADPEVMERLINLSQTEPKRLELEPEWASLIDQFLSYYQDQLRGEWLGLQKSYSYVKRTTRQRLSLPPLYMMDPYFYVMSAMFQASQATALAGQSSMLLHWKTFMKNYRALIAQETSGAPVDLIEKYTKNISEREARFEIRRLEAAAEKKRREAERKKAQQEKLRKMKERQQAMNE